MKGYRLNSYKRSSQKIKYHNLCVNFIENSISVDDITDSTWITDVSIVCDKTQTPPIIAICQYFGKDSEMDGDERAFSPTIIYLIDLFRDKPRVFICPTGDPSPFILDAIDKIKMEVEEIPSSQNLLVDIVHHVVNELIPQITD